MEDPAKVFLSSTPTQPTSVPEPPVPPKPEKPEPEPKQLGETPLPPIPPSAEQPLVFRKSSESEGKKPKKPFLIGGAILTLLLVSTAVAVYFVQKGKFGVQKKAAGKCSATTSCNGCGLNFVATAEIDCSCACQQPPPAPSCVDPGCYATCGTDAVGCPIQDKVTAHCKPCAGGGGGGPPTCTISGPSSLTVGGAGGSYTATATGHGDTVRRIEIWRAQENWLEKDKPGTGWRLIGKGAFSLVGFSSSTETWSVTSSDLTGQFDNKWWVVCNAYYDVNGARGMTNSCSGNPWGTDGTMADCGPNDNMQVALLTLSTPTTVPPTPTPTPITGTGTPPMATPTPPRVCCCWQGGCNTGYCQMLSSSSCQAPAAIRESTCCTTNPPTSTPIPTTTSTPTPIPPTPTPTSVTGLSCGSPCTASSECASGYCYLYCFFSTCWNLCMNPACPSEWSCLCSTPTPTPTSTPPPSPTAIPTLPPSGPTATGIPVPPTGTPAPTPTSSPLPSCLNVQVAVAGGGSLSSLKIGDSLTFAVSFGGTVEDVGVVIEKEGMRVKTITAGSQQTNSWTSPAYIIDLGSYEVSAYVKINGVWQ